MEISDNFNHSIIENMISGFALHSIITDENGNPIDYRYIEANNSFEKYTGLKRDEIIGKTILEIVPQIDKDTINWIQFFGQVALTGVSDSTEQYSSAFDRWYRVNAYCPEIGYFAVIFIDITDFKKQAEALNRKNKDLHILYEKQALLLKKLENSEAELRKKNEELSSLYEEILASEEELRQQNEVLFQKNEEITALYEELAAQEEELKTNYEQLNKNVEKLKKSESINTLILETSAEGVWQYDIAADFYSISPRFVNALGYSAKDLNHISNILDITHPDDRDIAQLRFNEHLLNKTEKFDLEYRLMCKNGSFMWVRSTGKVLRNLNGDPYLMAGSFLDITKLKEQQLKLEHMAYHDILTDLPNRSLFLEKLDRALAYADKIGKKLAVIFIDLDNFKDVNDTLGHSTGDLLLKALALRLKEHIRKQDMLTRLGGDEFAVMIQDIDSEKEVYEFCLRMKEKILEPFEFNGSRFNISPSMGISIYPCNASNGEELLKNADTAMYRSKNLGKNTIQLYQDYMRTDMLRRLSVESHLRNALAKNIFTLHYQPQVCLKTGKIRAFEALIRWTDEELGTISPVEFIPVAESAGLIVPLGEWILMEACREAKRLNDCQNTILMSVNISAVQLKQLDFAELVKRTLKETGLKPELLELEVTETTLISSIESTISMFEELRKLGVKISLDDFGTGYSSLSYLRKLPIDTLKIDKSFIKDIDRESFEKEITESIVSLVHKLNIEVIAEGVENGKQLAYLLKCNCDNIQGFLISKPLPASNAMELKNKNYMSYIGVQV